MAGATSSVRAKFDLETDPRSYRILASGGCTNVSSIDDKSDFGEVMTAFKDLGFKDNEVDGLFAVASADPRSSAAAPPARCQRIRVAHAHLRGGRFCKEECAAVGVRCRVRRPILEEGRVGMPRAYT